jgi:hypothetical protein
VVAARAAFNPGELERALALYRERAGAPGVHPPDALAGAHDSLRALHRREPDNIAHVCAALDLARAVLARDDLKDGDERAFWAELEAQDAVLAGGACPASSVEGAQANEVPQTDEALEAPVADTGEGQRPPTAEVKPEGPAPLPGAKDSRLLRRPRARVVTGSCLTALGVGLLGGMAGALAGRARGDAMIASITTNALAEDRDFTPAERAAAHEANERYVRLDATWPALLTVGSVSLITGLAVILAPTRGDSRARVRVAGQGLVYSF